MEGPWWSYANVGSGCSFPRLNSRRYSAFPLRPTGRGIRAAGRRQKESCWRRVFMQARSLRMSRCTRWRRLRRWSRCMSERFGTRHATAGCQCRSTRERRFAGCESSHPWRTQSDSGASLSGEGPALRDLLRPPGAIFRKTTTGGSRQFGNASVRVRPPSQQLLAPRAKRLCINGKVANAAHRPCSGSE